MKIDENKRRRKMELFDTGGRRSGFDRRQFSSPIDFSDRRFGFDRRSELGRRSGLDRRDSKGFRAIAKLDRRSAS